MVFFNSAVSRHRLNSPSGYNIPKPKFLYFVNFVTYNVDPLTLTNFNFFVKRTDRLQMQYDVQEMNQYNKKRLIQTRIQYQPLSFTMHDTVDNTAMRVIEAYNRFYFGDFDEKTSYSWNYDIVGSNFENTPNWGYSGAFTPNEGYFFKRIEIYEIFDQVYTQVNFINPKFTSVDFQNLDQEASGGNEVNITIKYEGVKIEKSAERITPDLANKFGLPYSTGSGINNGFSIPGTIDNSSFASIIGNVFGNVLQTTAGNSVIGEVLGNATNPIDQSLLNFGLNQLNSEIFGAKPNSILSGRLNVENIVQTADIIPGVAERLNAGETVRDISTAVIENVPKFLKF